MLRHIMVSMLRLELRHMVDYGERRAVCCDASRLGPRRCVRRGVVSGNVGKGSVLFRRLDCCSVRCKHTHVKLVLTLCPMLSLLSICRVYV